MRSSNPVFSSLTETARREPAAFGTTDQGQYGYGPQAGAGYGSQPGWGPSATTAPPYGQNPGVYGAHTGYTAPPPQATRAITVDDIVTKTGITLAVIVAFAVITFGVSLSNPAIGMAMTLVGMAGAFITVIVSVFGKKYGSKVATLVYAVFEGMAVGGFSFLVAGFSFKGVPAYGLIMQAILGTIGVFAGMLWVYKTGAIKVTSRFRRVMMGAIMGLVVLMLGNMLLMFLGINLLRGGGILSIIFGVVCLVVAALSFLLDFDEADSLVRAGAPAEMAWGVALGLAITLVWCYMEILRLLSYINRS